VAVPSAIPSTVAAYFADTVRQAWRLPAVWVLTGLGLLTGWLGFEVAILALGEGGSQAADLVAATSQTTAALAVVWVLGRLADHDREPGFAVAAAAAAPGQAGRLIGRLLGSLVTGAMVAAVIQVVLGLLGPNIDQWILLYIASLESTAVAGAWSLLLSSFLRSGASTLTSLLAWGAGHLPWGAAGLLEGGAGTALGALLPGPRSPAEWASALGYTCAATAGAVLLALAGAWGRAPGQRPGQGGAGCR
jgi:hypothetical protein